MTIYVPQLKEVQNTLELVQGQRNELRQEVKDLKAALADAKDTLEVSPTTFNIPSLVLFVSQQHACGGCRHVLV